MKTFLLTAAALLLPATVFAQDALERPVVDPVLAERTEQCVTMMSGFPDDGPESRYVFFRLSQELAKDVSPDLSELMVSFMAENETRRLPAAYPMIDVVEDIADPVLRRAAPDRTVAGMAHIAYFDALCGTFVQGQVDSLVAYKPALAEMDLPIREDALYLRQILAEALDRLGGGETDVVQTYTASLVTERDDIEYTGFTSDVDELEALYMGDLDTKLARSNDAVNEGADAESWDVAAQTARDMNQAARDQASQDRFFTLYRILGGR
ncbi:MAG: hypothetical protein WBF53_01365 [Litorimonas sp.]